MLYILTLEVQITTVDPLDAFKQDYYSTVGGDGDVGSVWYEPALLPALFPTIRVLSYSKCQSSTFSISVKFQKFST